MMENNEKYGKDFLFFCHLNRYNEFTRKEWKCSRVKKDRSHLSAKLQA